MEKRSYITGLCTIVSLLLISVCFSDWIYLAKVSSLNAKNENECTVSVTTIQFVNDVVTDNYSNKKEISTRTILEKTYWPKKVGDVITPEYVLNEKTTDIVDGIYSIIVTKRIELISKVDKGGWTASGYKYTYTYSTYEWTIETKKTNPIKESKYLIKVSKGSTLTPFDLNIDGYENYGFYSDESLSTIYDFSKPINSDSNIYIKYYENKSQLTTFINSKTSGVYNIYDSNREGSNGDFNLSSDFAYESNARFDFLNNSEIAKDVTINLTYLQNEIYPSPNTGGIADDDGANHRDAKSNVALDYYDNQYIGDANCSTMIRLNGDLTIRGILNVGAKVGGRDAASHFSEIIGKYAQIDLNGHNLIVDGGTLNAYGSIVDKVGKGKILVKNNGKIMGLMTVTDGKGGNQMTYGYAKGQSPFNEYRFCYIEVPIVAYYGTTINAYLKFDLGSLGISNIYANIIGPSGSSIFSWGDKKSDNDTFEIIPYINKNLYLSSPVNPSYKNIYLNMYYYRYKFVLNSNVLLNSQIPLNAIVNFKNLIKKDINIDWARIGVPIPSFFDIRLNKDYKLVLKAKMYLLPGSSFVTCDGSTLVFDPGEIVKYEDLKISVNVIVINVDVYIKGETKRNCGGLMAYNKSFNDYYYDKLNVNNYGVCGISDFWRYTNPSNHAIYGNVVINNIPDAYKYEISGKISFPKQYVRTIVSSPYLKTYDIKAEQAGSFWFSSSETTYKSSVNVISSFNIVPLISNGIAYLKDDKLNLTGEFNEVTNLFITGSKKYFFETPNDFLIGGSNPENQNALVDYTVTPSLVERTMDNNIIKSGSNYFIFYKGLFVPIIGEINVDSSYSSLNVNLRKFCSNNKTNLKQDSSKYDSALVSYDSAKNRWAFNNFN